MFERPDGHPQVMQMLKSESPVTEEDVGITTSFKDGSWVARVAAVDVLGYDMSRSAATEELAVERLRSDLQRTLVQRHGHVGGLQEPKEDATCSGCRGTS